MKFAWETNRDMINVVDDTISLVSGVSPLERTENAIIYRDESLKSVNKNKVKRPFSEINKFKLLN